MRNNVEYKLQHELIDLSSTSSRTERQGAYLVDRLILSGDSANVVFSAFTGMGKTTLMLGLAVCMAQGIPAWGKLHILRPLRVVYIDQEMVLGQIREVASKMFEVYGLPEEGMLTAYSGKSEAFSIERPHGLNALLEALHRIEPDFVFLDGWQWFVEGKVSDWEIVGRALAWWKKARKELGFGLCIIHHNKKAGDPRYRPKDPLEMASGTQSLMDQARTKLVYEHLPGYEDYGLLHGRCSKPEWNPVRIVLEYDAETQSHRVVDEDEMRYMFDKKTLRPIFGEAEITVKGKGLLNWLNAHGYRDADIARYESVSRVTVHKWHTGEKELSQERIGHLEQLKEQVESGRVTIG